MGWVTQVKEIMDFRRALPKDAKFVIAKNTLMQLAVKDTEFAPFAENLKVRESEKWACGEDRVVRVRQNADRTRTARPPLRATRGAGPRQRPAPRGWVTTCTWPSGAAKLQRCRSTSIPNVHEIRHQPPHLRNCRAPSRGARRASMPDSLAWCVRARRAPTAS